MLKEIYSVQNILGDVPRKGKNMLDRFNIKQRRIILHTFMLLIILFLFPPWYVSIRERTRGVFENWYTPHFWGIYFRYNPVLKPTLEQYDSIKNTNHDPKVYNIEEVGIFSIILYIEIFIVILISSILIYMARTKKYKSPDLLKKRKDSINDIPEKNP